MTNIDAINDMTLEQFEALLASGQLTIDDLEALISEIRDPEKIKALISALERLRDKERQRAEQAEAQNKSSADVDHARDPAQRAEEMIKELEEVLDSLRRRFKGPV